jgi:DNA-binding transcriptional MerR regulator
LAIDSAAFQSHAAMMQSIEIPKKLFFRIGEVCKLLHLEPYVLRFWESEFPMLSPTKGANGRRMYRQKDVEMVITIKRLLYDQGFTIAGAKRILANRKHVDSAVTRPLFEPNKPATPEVSRSPVLPAKLDQLRAELRNILTILNRRC